MAPGPGTGKCTGSGLCEEDVITGSEIFLGRSPSVSCAHTACSSVSACIIFSIPTKWKPDLAPCYIHSFYVFMPKCHKNQLYFDTHLHIIATG